MTIVRVGSTTKYSDGWDKAFAKNRNKPNKPSATKVATPAKKKAAKKGSKQSTGNRKAKQA